MGLRFSTVQSASIQASSKKFLTAMTNLRAVVAHFAPKVDAFSLEFGKTTLEREEVRKPFFHSYRAMLGNSVGFSDSSGDPEALRHSEPEAGRHERMLRKERQWKRQRIYVFLPGECVERDKKFLFLHVRDVFI